MKKLGYIFLFCLLLACSDKKNQSNSINWVKIEGDKFQFGSKKGKENEKPEVPVRVKDFKISSSEISVGQFHEFAIKTSYQTQAEKNGYSSIFKNGEWKEEKNLSYLNPNGENQEFELIKDWPAVHISFDDAQAYCKWKKGRLPSEIEMEFLMERSQQKKNEYLVGRFSRYE